MRLLAHSSLLFLFLFLIGCQRDEIQVYRIPKSLESTSPVEGAFAAKPSDDIRWKIPSGWVAQPLSEMRAGSFLIKGKNGQTADVSVIALAGSAGGNLANINRWRQQIDLPPLSQKELDKKATVIAVAGRQMIYVNFVSEKPLINNQFKKRVVATIYARNQRSWFFKLMGEDRTVRSAERDFIQFLKSLEFMDHE